MFYADPGVLFVYTHQFPFYPGTGAVSEAGHGAGVGVTLNVPLEAGATDADHALVWNDVIDPALVRFAPDLIVVSAGFDGHQDNPLGSRPADDRLAAIGHGCPRFAREPSRHVAAAWP